MKEARGYRPRGSDGVYGETWEVVDRAPFFCYNLRPFSSWHKREANKTSVVSCIKTPNHDRLA
jgi:hypothetical protein